MFDYHTHSSFSDDSPTPIVDMVEAAYALGLSEIAITDHYDPEYANRSVPFFLDFPAYHRALDHMYTSYEGKIKVVKGIELGLQKKVLTHCSKIAQDYDYDFILGGFHCAENKELYGGDFFKGITIERAYQDFYSYVFDCLSIFKDYSVLAHFNIIDRYAEETPKDHVYFDIVESILKMMIEDGKGIEINTSSFRYGMGRRMTPSLEILRKYKDLGGDIITIGSDAHFPKDVGYKLDSMPAFLKGEGFRFITTFDHLKPFQNKI